MLKGIFLIMSLKEAGMSTINILGSNKTGSILTGASLQIAV